MKTIIPLLVLLTVSIVGPARAETTLCTEITSLPAVISNQGAYCLHRDLSTAINGGAAIAINANNVTLDCNGWKIGGLAAGLSTTTTGIRALSRQNATIRNCGVRGFQTGISMWGGAGHLIEDNRVDNSTYVGILLLGDSLTVRRNRIIDTGGRPGSDRSLGISLSHESFGVLISDNQVVNVTVTDAPNGWVYGLYFGGVGHEFARNLFANLMPTGTGRAYGIYGSGGGLASLRDNTAINPALAAGAGFDGGDASQCRGNMVRGFTQTLAYCVDVAGNLGN